MGLSRFRLLLFQLGVFFFLSEHACSQSGRPDRKQERRTISPSWCAHLSLALYSGPSAGFLRPLLKEDPIPPKQPDEELMDIQPNAGMLC